MRNLEKGILLAELINPDLPSFEQIKNLIAWIRDQECYTTLLENMEEIKKSSTLLAHAIYDEFKAIDLDRVNSIEEGLISYAKILYLSQISTPNFYVNPLLVLNKKERDIKLDDVIVKFHDSYITLKELGEDKSYSFDEKYSFIKSQVNKWEQDVYERIEKPAKYFKNENPRNLPKIRIMTFLHYVVGIIYLGLIGFLAYGFASNNPTLNTIFSNFDYHTFGPRNYLFLGFLAFFSVSLIVYIIGICINYHKYHKYAKCRKIIIEKDHSLLPYIHKQGERLLDYILSSFETRSRMNDVVFKYSSSLTLYEYVLYLYNINYRYKKIKKIRLSHFDMWMCVFTLMFLALTIGSIII